MAKKKKQSKVKRVIIEYEERPGEEPLYRYGFEYENLAGYTEVRGLLRACEQDARKHRNLGLDLTVPLPGTEPVSTPEEA